MLWQVSDNILNPFREFRNLQREMNELFNDYFDKGEPYPAVNIWSGKDRIILTAELPGVDPDDIEIEVVNNQLSISGELKPVRPDGDDNVVYHRIERSSGKFTRTFRLPVDVDADKVEANYKDGILAIRLPIKESSKPKRIAIKSK